MGPGGHRDRAGEGSGMGMGRAQGPGWGRQREGQPRGRRHGAGLPGRAAPERSAEPQPGEHSRTGSGTAQGREGRHSSAENSPPQSRGHEQLLPRLIQARTARCRAGARPAQLQVMLPLPGHQPWATSPRRALTVDGAGGSAARRAQAENTLFRSLFFHGAQPSLLRTKLCLHLRNDLCSH